MLDAQPPLTQIPSCPDPSEQVVLSAACAVPHTPLVQVATRQGLVGCWQSVGVLQTHAPATHVVPPPQVVPHVPQLALSVSVSTHPPSQHRKPSALQFSACEPVTGVRPHVMSLQVVTWQI
jgi:hypothetical protein